ncbi:MAG: molybdenum cofactor guanylyltransferase [Chloroflexota bacterium]
MESGITGIVLAGGRSRRFGSDKLATVLAGRPLVEHAIDALATVADEVVVVIAADAVPGTAGAPGQGSGPVPPGVRAVHAAAEVRPWLRVVRDGMPDAGPLAGFLAGAWAAHHPALVVVAGDQPALVPDVLALLAARVGMPAADGLPTPRAAQLAATGAAEDGVPLPFAADRDAAVVAAEGLLRDGARSLRALLLTLGAATIPAATWRQLDPDGATLRDVDVPADLPATPVARRAP